MRAIAGLSHLLLLFLLLSLLPDTSAAQSRRGDRWQAVLESGDIVWDFRLVGLEADRLSVRQGDSVSVVKVGEIKELRLIQPSEVQIGEGAIAGAMGALTGADDLVYDMGPLDFAARVRVVQQILLKYPPESGQ